MNIDLKPLLIGENERVRWYAVLDCEVLVTKDVLLLWYVRDAYDDVDVFVTSILLSRACYCGLIFSGTDGAKLDRAPSLASSYPKSIRKSMLMSRLIWQNWNVPGFFPIAIRSILSGMETPVLQTKLYIPPPRPQLVARPRLVERLNEGLPSQSASLKVSIR